MSYGHGVFVANVRAVSRIEAQRGSKQIFVAGGSGATAAGAALLLDLDSAESSARTMAQEFQYDWFSYNIPGFERYLTALRSTPCRLLEIGSHEGRSTCWLLENVATHTDARIDCIDPYVQDNFWPNIAASSGLQRVSFHRGTSQDALRVLPRNAFDFVYIDGAHWMANVLEDGVMSFPLCKVGGLIAFDDYLWDDPKNPQLGCPKPSIDFILQAYTHKLEVLEKGHQVWVRKKTD